MSNNTELSLFNYAWLEPLRSKLFECYKNNQFSHAQLLMGPEGLGQITLVNYLIQLLLCFDKSAAPCGHCKACLLGSTSTHPDLYWITLEDKASTIKIDQIRETLQAIEGMSQLGSAKIVVITHSDKMTINAANALLKRLEEPMQNTYFLLLAEASHTIPKTIISRCACHRLNKPSILEAKQWIENQNIQIENFELLYNLSLGAPETIKLLIEEVGFEPIKVALESLLAFLKKTISLNTAIRPWLLLPCSLRWKLLFFWLQAYSKIYFSNKSDPDIQALAGFLPDKPQLNQESLYQCYEYCLSMISISSKTNLNEQLLFENILIWLLGY